MYLIILLLPVLFVYWIIKTIKIIVLLIEYRNLKRKLER